MKAWYLMFLVCNWLQAICYYTDAEKVGHRIAPFAEFEDCVEEGIKTVLASTDLHGYQCEERKLER